MPDFHCDLTQNGTPLPHFWEHTVGSGHAPLALRADWQHQLQRCHRELGVRHVRFHGLLADNLGTLIVHRDRLLYSFLNADHITDFLVSIGMKPFVELSYMPGALASGDQTVFDYQANVSPPRDYGQWAILIEKIVRHWIDRYGADEVRTWPLEVWNEPNLSSFWPAGMDAYHKLYAATVRAAKNVDAALRVGGPATAKNEKIAAFLEFCANEDLPVDFVTTHIYPTDPLGSQYQDTEAQLAHSHRGFLREQAEKTRREAGDRPVFYTEWNSSSNPRDPLHDEPYAAAFVAKTLLDNAGLVEGYSFWTFSDIFEENYFPSEPFHGGFGLLNLYGVPKPTYRVFQLLHHLGDTRLATDGSHATVDAWTTRGRDAVTVILTNHALPRHKIETEHVRMTLAHTPASIVGAYVQRIDADHANPKRLWQEIGAPHYLHDDHVALLESASNAVPTPLTFSQDNGTVQFEINLPPHAVAAVTLQTGQHSIESEAPGA